MNPEDIYALFGDDEPTAQEKAQAIAAALRKRQASSDDYRGLSGLASLGANPLLSGLARHSQSATEQLGAQTDKGMATLADAGKTRFLGRLREKDPAAADADLAYKRAKTEFLKRPRLGPKPPKAPDINKLSTDLRKEFNGLPEVKAFTDVEVSFDKIKRAAAEPSAAGDIALITGYMKIIDPGSFVKEGEFATAQNAGGVPEKVRAQFNALKNGQRLAPGQRADFVKQSENLYLAHEDKARRTIERYRELASKSGLAPDDVALGIKAPAATAATPPAAALETPPIPAAGETKVVNGKTYTLNARGKWEAE